MSHPKYDFEDCVFVCSRATPDQELYALYAQVLKQMLRLLFSKNIIVTGSFLIFSAQPVRKCRAKKVQPTIGGCRNQERGIPE